MNVYLDERTREALYYLLKETFEGPRHGRSWYTSTEPDTGVLGTIHRLTLEQVNQQLPHSEASVAAHVHHVFYYLKVVNCDLRSQENETWDWNESWEINEVTADEWGELKRKVYTEYFRLLNAINAPLGWDQKKITQVTAALAHCAYHLGSMRQMMKMV